MDRAARRTPVVVGIVLGVAAVVVLGALSLPFGVREGRLDGFVGIALVAVLVGAAAAFTTWRPAAALAVAWAAAVVQMLFRLPVLPADLVVLGVLFAVGASRSARLRWSGLGSAVVGGIIAASYLALPAAFADLQQSASAFVLLLIASTVTLVLAWTFGLLLWTIRRSQAARVEAAAAQVAAIEEQERSRIARDMHDVVAHSLAVIVVQADGARYLTETDTARAKEALATISAVAREALGDVRVLLERLRHSQGDLPQPGAADLGALLAQVREAGLDVLAEVGGAPAHLPAASDLALYRIVQESLTNALRHGDATRPVRVEIAAAPHGLRIEVRSALRPGAPVAAPGHGLLGIRERARLAGGEAEARVRGEEFVVTATLPAGDGGTA